METQKKTFDEIIAILEQKLRNKEEGDEDYNEDDDDDNYHEQGAIGRFDEIYSDEEFAKLGLGKIEEKEDGAQGGCDQGSHYERVFHFVDHDVYLKITGYYQSYDGVTFDGGFENCASEVRPQQETITVYK